jgi:hypothetical protein
VGTGTTCFAPRIHPPAKSDRYARSNFCLVIASSLSNRPSSSLPLMSLQVRAWCCCAVRFVPIVILWVSSDVTPRPLVWRNRDRRPPALLVVTLVYFIAAWAVSSTFSPSFTFENFNNTMIFYPTLDSITTALTSLGDIGYVRR